MTRERFDDVSRDGLIDQLLASHTRLQDVESQLLLSHRRLEEIEAQLRWFKTQLFGAKSERRIIEPIASQLSLGESLAQANSTEPAPTTEVRGHPRRKRSPNKDEEESGLRFDDSVEVETIVLEDPETAGLPEQEIEVISEKRTHRLAQRPGAYVILETVRRVTKRKSTGKISCAPAAPSVLPGSYADVSLLAGMLVDKFRYHLPLYRQHQRIQAMGITISRSSLSNWVHQSADLLEPIYRAQLDSILGSSVLAMDETPIRAGRKSKGKMRTAYFWPLYGDQMEVAFPYASSRAKFHIDAILGEFQGTLLTDGYTAYEGYAEVREKVEHALCWAHTRRGFVKAEAIEPVRAGEALARIGKLYEVERGIATKGLEGEAKQKRRGDESREIVSAFFEWIKQELVNAALLPTNPFTKAAHYALDRQRGLEVYLSNPDVPIDTNHLERALRPIPMGRKNWLFCWTEMGAEKVGIIQSLLATCVLHEVDPYDYLVDVLQRIDRHPSAQVAELTPRKWKHLFADDPLRSLIHRP